MFVFERIIGMLQRTNINYKLGKTRIDTFLFQKLIDSTAGQLEGTMLETFSASVNFRTLLQRHNDVPAVHKVVSIIDRATQDRSRDPLAGVLEAYSDYLITPTRTRCRKPPPLPQRASNALEYEFKHRFGQLPPSPITSIVSHEFKGVSFTIRMESKRDSTIFYRPQLNETLYPAVIQYIVSVSVDRTAPPILLCIVERFASLQDKLAMDPFTSQLAFGASIWSNKMLPELTVIAFDQVISHAVGRPWVNGTLVLKPLDRVSNDCIRLLYFILFY